jgi:hypothetical protein
LADVVVQVGHSMKLLTNAITNFSFYEAFDELEGRIEHNKKIRALDECHNKSSESFW